MKYRRGYKYQLAEMYTIETGISQPGNTILWTKFTKFISMDLGGTLQILDGYAWDGPTVSIDAHNMMRGSLVHDALYQLMQEGLLDVRYRKTADRLFQRMCIEDGMSQLKAWAVYRGVRRFGKLKLKPNPILEAP